MKVEAGVSPALRVRAKFDGSFHRALKHLTMGKIYNVVQNDSDIRYTFVDDSGYQDTYHKDYVEVVGEQPDEYTGSSVSYYKVSITNPVNPDAVPYEAECNDIIEALGMNFAEGNAFKAIWRSCAARKCGNRKKGYDNGLYDAEKVVFFGQRMVALAKAK